MRESWLRSLLTVLLGLFATAPTPQPIVHASSSDPAAPAAAEPQHVVFTGEVLPVLYVRDVRTSVEFYRKLGFEFRHCFDYDEGREVSEWTKDEPPI